MGFTTEHAEELAATIYHLRRMSDSEPNSDSGFKELVKRSGIVLRQRGFTGSGQHYRRERGEQWQAIHIQKSQWRVTREDPICFYVNIGIDFPAIRFARWMPRAETLSKFIATKADTTFRIDELLPDERFDWFAVAGIDGWNQEKFCHRFERVLTDQLVPLLDRMATPQGLSRVLRMMPWMARPGSLAFVGKDLAPPDWDPADCDAGKWKQDKRGLWWKKGER